MAKGNGGLSVSDQKILILPMSSRLRRILFITHCRKWRDRGRQKFSCDSTTKRLFNVQVICLLKKKVKVKVTQSCPTLFDPMDYTVHGILQARILEWVAIPFSRGSSQPRDWTQVSLIASEFFTSWATREAQFGDFPGDPMAKVPCPQCRGWDSIPSWGTRSCVLQLSTDWRE